MSEASSPAPTGRTRAAAAARTGAIRAVGAARATGRATTRGVGAARRGVRRVTNARGAGESGLSRMLELHFVSTAADTLIITALASTIFFAVPTAEARSQVATSLAVTLVPFTLLAPVIGPLLDRVPHGRRYALAATMLVRAFLAWVLAGAVAGSTDGAGAALSLYPAALGFLVAQKAYLVTRAAAVPRVLPAQVGLVSANSRISMAGVIAMTLAAPLGVLVTNGVGPSWTLRLAFVIFAAGVVPALALPARVDSSAGEQDARLSTDRGDGTGRDGSDRDGPEGALPTRGARLGLTRRARWSTGPRVVLALRGNAWLRAFTGFLTLFLAFRLRSEPLTGIGAGTAVALVIAAAGVGGGVGTALGGLIGRLRPEGVVAVLLVVVAVASTWASLAYGLWPVLTVALVAGLAQALGKLCLDAVIQRDVPERVRTSAFARSESVLQLAWVVGGGAGLALPLSGAWGLGIAALAVAGAAAFIVRSGNTLRRAAAARGRARA